MDNGRDRRTGGRSCCQMNLLRYAAYLHPAASAYLPTPARNLFSTCLHILLCSAPQTHTPQAPPAMPPRASTLPRKRTSMHAVHGVAYPATCHLPYPHKRLGANWGRADHTRLSAAPLFRAWPQLRTRMDNRVQRWTVRRLEG